MNQPPKKTFSPLFTNYPIKTPIKMEHRNKENRGSIYNETKRRTIKDKNKMKKTDTKWASTSFKNLINLRMKKSVLSSIEYREESFELGEKEAFR